MKRVKLNVCSIVLWQRHLQTAVIWETCRLTLQLRTQQRPAFSSVNIPTTSYCRSQGLAASASSAITNRQSLTVIPL